MTKQSESLVRSAPRLVWMLAGLGVVGCMLCLALLFNVFAREDKLDQESARLSTCARDLIRSFGAFASETQHQLTETLDPQNAPDPLLAEKLADGGRDLGRDIDALVDINQDAQELAGRFRATLGAVGDLHARCFKWTQARRAQDASIAGTLARTLDTIASVRASVAGEQGRARLRRLKDIAAFRAASGPEAANLASSLLSPVSEGDRFGSVEAELSDLALYAQQLTQELRADAIATIRENNIRPALARLHQGLSRSAGGGQGVGEEPADRRLESLLLGPEGLATLAEASCTLRAGQIALEHEVDQSTGSLRAISEMVSGILATNQANCTAEKTSAVQAARHMSSLVLAGLAASTVLLGRKVSRSLRAQATELHSANDRLDQALSQANAANTAKTDFLANMSHEIRTPMTAILGFTDLLDMPETSPQARREHVSTIRRNGQHLLSIINDILDLSKIEANQMTVERLATSPVGVVEEVLSLMRVRAAAKNIELRCAWSWPQPRELASDPLRLRQILINLIGNAIKFTDAGAVTLTIEWNPSRTALLFGVADTGVGMSAEQVSRLFRPFTQADETTTRRFGGSGMGLAISKRLAELLRGDIAVVSTPGKGSTFTLTLPTEPGVPILEKYPDGTAGHAAQQPAPASAAPLKGVRILLAEDGPDNQRLIQFHLRRAGAETALAGDGRVACQMALEAREAGRPFDTILMDMQMPEMDGYSATSHLREQAYRGRIVALTAHAMSGDRERCLAAGCDDYLNKPIDAARLVAACLGSNSGAPAARAA